ncbi:MAG: AAA family ATPase [Candidatus Woesearchaeota archaeon]|jgi:hypothetical protein|nr:AAA family ATPase [Candidatus Woesearchaeota archaeon]
MKKNNKIILGKDQLGALQSMKDFINSSKISFSLVGYAGTGKTALIQYIINYLEDKFIPYTLCAPTHKAKVVLERFTGREGMTLHKLLSLSPMIEVMNLDFNDLKFTSNFFSNTFPYDSIIICDESSMINDDLYDLLTERCKQFRCKLITAGDRAQLKPVNSITHSKVFDNPNKALLTNIYRQSKESGLVDILPILREQIIPEFTPSLGEDGSLYCFDNAKDFVMESLPYFRKAIKNSDILEAKILAYTNNRVGAFNKKMKTLLFGDKKEYNKLEILTGRENLSFNKTKFWNSMDYIIADEPRPSEVFIPGFLKLPGYYLNLYNASTKNIEEIFILSKQISKDYLDSLAYHIEITRLKAVDAKKRRSRQASMLWKEYYKLIGSFTSPVDLYYSNRLIRKKSFDYGYAITTHRSQGSSINNVFIDMNNIKRCRDKEELRQLQYVSVSRSSHNAYILQ